MNNKEPKNFRLTPEAILLLVEMSKNLGISQAAVIEIAIRSLAKTELKDK